jgi:hypothetical protein
MRIWVWSAVMVPVLCSVPLPLAAQDVGPGTVPATLAYTEGSVDLDQQGLAQAATAPTLLVDGDRVRTRDGRAEIVFGDGSMLHADRETTLEWLGDRHLRLLAGRAMLRTSPAATAFVIDTPPGTVRLDPRGEYDLNLRDRTGALELSVVRGVAELGTSAERLVVRGGEALVTDGSSRPSWHRYNSARLDAFSRWAYDRANGSATAASAQYLPYELRSYSPALDQYGRWDYLAPYGYVWYPSVAVGWRPYYHGHWRHTKHGWTWFGIDRWAWPTHHFGRWGFSVNSWFWIPGKVWGPAWVSWGFSSHFVSWCPLGWDGRPVVPFWGKPGPGHHDPWRAWNVVPRGRFGDRRPVQSLAVDGRTIRDASRTFVVQSAPPPTRGYAVPRGEAIGNVSPAVRSANAWANSRGSGSVRRPGDTTVSTFTSTPTTRITSTAPPDTTPTRMPNAAVPRRSPEAGYVNGPSPAPPGAVRTPQIEPVPGPGAPDSAWLSRSPQRDDGQPAFVRRRDDPRPQRSFPSQPPGGSDSGWMSRPPERGGGDNQPAFIRRRDDPPPQGASPPPRVESGGSARGGARNPDNAGGGSWGRSTRPAGPPPDASSSGASARSGSRAAGGGAVRRPR